MANPEHQLRERVEAWKRAERSGGRARWMLGCPNSVNICRMATQSGPPDFDHDAYVAELEKLVRDLKAEQTRKGNAASK